MAVLGSASGRRPMLWHPALLSIPVGAAATFYGFGLGEEWRVTTATMPLDPGPAAGLLAVAAVAGLSVVSGLWLLLTNRGPGIGPSLFALGVGLSCGVAIGFFIGPGFG
jgi:hypothetical protein